MNLRQAMRMHPDDWTADELAELCLLMGIPHSGTKATRITRLLSAADLRTLLASYERPAQMTAWFSRKTLAALARRAGIYAGGNKYGLAAGLLSWRNECRRRGQEYRDAARAAAAELPQQYRLDMDVRC